jgi:hypothetical protein
MLLQPRRVFRRPKQAFCAMCYDIVMYPRSPEAEYERKRSLVQGKSSSTDDAVSAAATVLQNGELSSESDVTPEDMPTWFDNTMLFAIIINTIALAIQYFGQVNSYLKQINETINNSMHMVVERVLNHCYHPSYIFVIYTYTYSIRAHISTQQQHLYRHKYLHYHMSSLMA